MKVKRRRKIKYVLEDWFMPTQHSLDREGEATILEETTNAYKLRIPTHMPNPEPYWNVWVPKNALRKSVSS